MPATHLRESPNRQLERLSDQALLDEFGELVRRVHHHLASLLRHIDLIDRRKLWARKGYPSLFGVLVRRYHMSESSAVKRIGAARLARRFPVLCTMVARGELHLSAIHCIQAHLTPENHERVLAEAKHKTMRQLEELVARLAPKPDVPTTLRKLPSRPGEQFAHRKPWAKGGSDTSDNIGLRCPAHNALEADRDYGARFMAHKRKQKSLKVREPVPTSSDPP